MGENAKRKSDGQIVKIGTCESMYYLRYEDREKVEQVEHSLDASSCKDLFWRLPYPDEDDVLIGEYGNHNRGLRLCKTNPKSGYVIDFTDPKTMKTPGNMQLTHKSGLLINVKCYHGEKLPKGSDDMESFWNGKSWSLELDSVKNTSNGVVPVVRCRHCDKLWQYGWDDILPFVADDEMKRRLKKYI